METSDLSVTRNEYKYILSKASSADAVCLFDNILSRDKHSIISGYHVRSLYFDTINNLDYLSKMAGTENRKKIRLRIYSPDDDFCKLEVKQKYGELEHKIVLLITREDANELINLNYSILTKYFSQSKDAIFIYGLLTEGIYRPVVLIEYERIAYSYPLNDTRITIDMDLRSSESCLNLFCKDPGYNVLLTEKDILEVKYNNKLVKFISDNLKRYDLVQLSLSKYCMGRKIFCDFNF